MKMTKWLKQQKQNRRESRLAARQSMEQARPAHEPFVLEILEDRILLSATPMEAVVTTDKQDYSPGETAIITTMNQESDMDGATIFADGEMVQFQVTRTDGVPDYPSGNLPWYVIDGGVDAYQTDVNGDGQLDWVRADNDGVVNGSISTTWFVEDQYASSSLLVTATGLESEAEATHAFTDAGAFSYSGTTTATIAAGSATSITNVVLTVPGNNGTQVPTFTFASTGSPSITVVNSSTPGAGEIGVTYTATSDSDGGTIGTVNTGSGATATNRAITYSFNIYVGSGVAANTYSVKAVASPSTGTIGQGPGLTIAVTVPVSATATTTTVSSSLNASTYGDSVTFTATVTAASGTTAPAGSVSFYAGTTLLGTDTVANGTGSGTSTWSITTSSLNAGNHSITAVYAPATGFTTSTSSALTQTVNQKALTITGAVAQNKVYDGTTTATVNFGGAMLVGIVGTDAVTINSSAYQANFNTKDVGTNKPITVIGVTLGGPAAGNYTVSQPSGLTANITAKDITGSFTADNKVYDGNDDAAVLTTDLQGEVNGDAVTLSITLAEFSDKNVANGKTVTAVTYSLTGADKDNYNLTSVSTTTANITQATLHVYAVSDTKVFDWTTSSSGTPTVNGLQGNDSVTGLTQVFDSMLPGTRTLSVTAYTVNDGNGGSNYTVTTHTASGEILAPSTVLSSMVSGNLIIVGTSGNDSITVDATNPSGIKVNGTGSYTVNPSTGRVIVYGLACDDNISLTGNVNLEAHGGLGNDTITGGAGHDVIRGGEGNDTLTGSAGNDVLIGGAGSDRLVGSAGHDILAAGELSSTFNYDSLRTMSAAWAANWTADSDLADNNYDDDVVDEAGDQLTGSSGHDWFIISSNDKITDINSLTKDGDKITNI